jgi:hypothetical protein
MSPTPPSPDTIVLIHGFWVTPRSWEHWIPYHEAKRYRVLAPAYPGFEVEVEAPNEVRAGVRWLPLGVPVDLGEREPLGD